MSCRGKILFTDVDDTLTSGGVLLPETYQALWDLYNDGVVIIPVTGGCAGWCDQIIRTWPVAAVIGEGGAFYLRKKFGQLSWSFWEDARQHKEDQSTIMNLFEKTRFDFDFSYSLDQPFRLVDVAIDYNQEASLLDNQVKEITDCAEAHGFTAKISSIHINISKGDFNKAKMASRLLLNEFDIDVSDESSRSNIFFSGDAPNDEPMFELLDNTYGVANIRKHWGKIDHKPKHVTKQESGLGFIEVAKDILSKG